MAKQQINGGQQKVAWTSYSASPVGWSSLTTNDTRYFKQGKLVSVYISLEGTSNSTAANMQLPSIPSLAQQLAVTRVKNNGVISSSSGLIVMNSSNTQLDFYPSMAAGSWTASGAKQIYPLIIQYVEA